MKASSESGLCAATISRGSTDGVGMGGEGLHTSVQHDIERSGKKPREIDEDKTGKGGHPSYPANPEVPIADIRKRITRMALSRLGHHSSVNGDISVQLRSPDVDEAALIVVRFYRHLPPALGGPT